MKKAIFFTESCGTDKKNEFESCRGEGRISINTAFGFSLLGYECYIVSDYKLTSPKKIWENVYITNKPDENEMYDIAFAWNIELLKNRKNYIHKILSSYADTPRFSKMIKKENLDIILTCNVPCMMHEPSHFNCKNTQYLPVIYPIPSINIGFLPYKFEPKLPELKVFMCHSSWEDSVPRSQYYIHKQQLALDILTQKYKVKLYILVANEEVANKCQSIYNLSKCNKIHYLINKNMRYDDIIKSLLNTDLCISIGAIFMPGPLLADMVSLGKPMIYIIEGFPSRTEFNNNCLCKCVEHMIICPEDDDISTKKIITSLNNLEISFDCYRKAMEDYDFKNWKKYTEDFLIKNCDYDNENKACDNNNKNPEINDIKNNGDNEMNTENATKINKFGDRIDWDYHVDEILTSLNKDPNAIFYKPDNHEKMNHLKKYRQNGRVLDCGCHIGRWIEVFRGNGYDYVGVDQSHKALETARKYKPDGKFVHSLLWNMPFDNEFDIVHTNAVLQHNILSEQEKILPKMNKALKHNGILVITESTEPKQTATQRTYEGWITFVEKYGFKFMESWHKNPLGFEDNYLFIKVNNITSQSMNIELNKPLFTNKSSKIVTKESLKQLISNKTIEDKNSIPTLESNHEMSSMNYPKINVNINLHDDTSNYNTLYLNEYWNDKTTALIECILLWRRLKLGEKCYFEHEFEIPLNIIDYSKSIFEEAGFNFIDIDNSNKITFKKSSITKIENWKQLRHIHELLNNGSQTQ